jgi:predicted RNase H-like HicB family nuclease
MRFKMARKNYDYDYDSDDDLEFDSDADLDYEGELDFEEDDNLDLGPVSTPEDSDDVDISMEVDAEGREIWYAQDPRIPGSSSIGHSAEEAVEGVEDRRREYREMLRQSREGASEEQEAEEIPELEHTGEHEVQISLEVDETGNEVWYAKDPRVPGSSSIGHSAEEAVEGLEERRKKYRDVLNKSRRKKTKEK